MSEGVVFLFIMVAVIIILILFSQISALKKELNILEETLGYQKNLSYKETPNCDLLTRLKEIEFVLSSEEEIAKQWEMADEAERQKEHMNELQETVKR